MITGLTRLGAKGYFLGAIGQDDLGDQFVQLLKGGFVGGHDWRFDTATDVRMVGVLL